MGGAFEFGGFGGGVVLLAADEGTSVGHDRQQPRRCSLTAGEVDGVAEISQRAVVRPRAPAGERTAAVGFTIFRAGGHLLVALGEDCAVIVLLLGPGQPINETLPAGFIRRHAPGRSRGAPRRDDTQHGTGEDRPQHPGIVAGGARHEKGEQRVSSHGGNEAASMPSRPSGKSLRRRWMVVVQTDQM